MSLRVRLILLTVALVAIVALALSLLYLRTLVDSLTLEASRRGELASQQVLSFLTDHINQHSEAYEVARTLEETKVLWNEIVATDQDVRKMLGLIVTGNTTILETNVAGEDGQILISSDPSRTFTPLKRLELLSSLRQQPFWRQLITLATRRPDYETTVNIGIPGQKDTLFIIQVVTSSVFLRDAFLPSVQRLVIVSAGALGVTLLLTVFATNGALRPIRRIEQTIDRIAQGSFRGEEDPGTPSRTGAAKEFRVMESKLNLLGQQMRGVQHDASELRHNVDQLIERMASQLDVASRLAAISKLSGGVAHEIKNPLNAIVLRLDLLRERLGEPEEVLQGEIDILSREALRLDRVVKTFLDFSRPVEINLRELNLCDLVREVAEFMKPQAKSSGVDLTVDTPEIAAQIKGDPDMLKQALLNLVTNALEAMPKGGSLHLTVTQGGDRVHVKVADTGPGIPPEVRSKVFQLYFTTKGKGSGIGLAMTYRAVQMHNGTIEFTSEAQGTTFHLSFPNLVANV
jgi:signal transduction histidine kinase